MWPPLPRPPPPLLYLHLSITYLIIHSFPHSFTHSFTPWLPFAWQAHYTEPPGGAAAGVGTAGPRLASRGRRSTESFLAAFRVAGAVHRAFWRTCAHAGPRLASRGRRSTESLLAAFRVAQYTEPCGGVAVRVGAAVPRLASRGRHSTKNILVAFRVAGAIHRALWRSCGACGRRWTAAGFVWQAQYRELPGCLTRGRARRLIITIYITIPFIPPQFLIITYHNLSHTNSSQLHFSHLTHHNSTAHHNSISDRSISFPNSSQFITPNSSQFHFSHLTSHSSLITSQFLITIYPITIPLLTLLLTPYLSHQNSSQVHFSHLTSQIHFSHLISHTSPKFTLKSYIFKNLTCGVIRFFYFFKVVLWVYMGRLWNYFIIIFLWIPYNNI